VLLAAAMKTRCPLRAFCRGPLPYVTQHLKKPCAHMCNLWARSWPKLSPHSNDGWGTAPPQSADPDTERYLLITRGRTARQVSEDKPLVVVLDDFSGPTSPASSYCGTW